MIELNNARGYDVIETAEILKTSAQTIRKYIKTGKLEGQQIGRKIIIPEQSIKKFIRGIKTND